MRISTRNRLFSIVHYTIMILLAVVMLFPLVVMFFSSFKNTTEMFSSINILPKEWNFNGYINGWYAQGGRVIFGSFIWNTFVLAFPMSFGVVLSSLIIGYGFSRFNFPFKNILFSLMISLLMLPAAILIIPRYLLFSQINWVDTYLPFWVPAALGTSSFFIYMFIQFFRGIPMDLDEAATIDGCGTFGILVKILIPLCKPVIISAAMLQFMWAWNDFFQQNIYISSVVKYPVQLGLRMNMDASQAFPWDCILAMSLVSIIPCVIFFLFMQKYFVEGIATSGLKG